MDLFICSTIYLFIYLNNNRLFMGLCLHGPSHLPVDIDLLAKNCYMPIFIHRIKVT